MTVREEAEGLLEQGTGPRPFVPAADWLDEGASLTLLLDVPGVDVSSLEMYEDGDQLTLAGTRSAGFGSGARSEVQGAGRLLLSERGMGRFSRTLTFPEEVVAGSGQAELNAGVLRVQFQKVHPTIDAACQEVFVPETLVPETFATETEES